MLTERQKMILSVIVDDYIRSAEPVGSRTISKRSDIGFSPATIRNEMSDLEELGFLEQPHTSAGRIPSQKGYRYYVDHLLKLSSVHNNDASVIKQFFAERVQELENVIQHVASVLSSLTNYTSIVLGPEVFSTTLRHLQILPLNDGSAVAIIVTSTGHVENKLIQLPPGMPASDIEKVVAILNSKLTGVPLLQLKSKLYNEVGNELGRYVSRYEEIIRMLDQVVDNDEEDRIFLGGATNMLTQPEFRDVDKVKSILDMLDETPTLIRMFAQTGSGIQVRIGAENSELAIRSCSLITATYSVEGKLLGSIGILGPTRMEYGKVMSLLDHLTKDLAVVLGRWY